MEIDGMQFFGNSPIGKQHMFSKRVPDISFGRVIGSNKVQTANFDGTPPFESVIFFFERIPYTMAYRVFDFEVISLGAFGTTRSTCIGSTSQNYC